jgi:ubiquinol-cytochrome c reductase iron-sulfur subunit
MSNSDIQEREKNHPKDSTKRDFMVLTGVAMTGVGALMATWPFISALNPAADVLAVSTIEVDLSAITPGQTIKVKWRGKPVFIRNRTAQEIEEARSVPLNQLRDPQKDEDRVKPNRDNWLITVGICTHLGCIPISNQGDYNGWFCPCHGSHYDVSGRIRKGPAPLNLAVPDYNFLSDNVIKIG